MTKPITNRKISLIFSCVAMTFAGSLSAFSMISDGFRERFNISFSEVNVISAVGNASLYFSYFIAGPIYDYFGPTITMMVCSVSFTLGYALLYASYIGIIPTNLTLLALYYFIASFGAVCSYTAVIGANMSSYDNKHIGLISGILLLFYGLSGTVFSNIFKLFFTGNVQGFLGFMAISILISNGVSTVFIRKFERNAKVENSDLILSLRAPNSNQGDAVGTKKQVMPPQDSPLITFDAIEMKPQIRKEHDKKKIHIIDTKQELTTYPTHYLSSSDTPLLKKNDPDSDASRNLEKGLAEPDLPIIEGQNYDAKDHSVVKIIASDRIDPMIQSPLGEPLNSVEEPINEDSSLTPREILMSSTFWMYAFANVFMQGLTYIANVNAIIRSTSSKDMPEQNLIQETAFHLTLISISQSCSRLIFGILTDYMAKLRLSRTVLFLVAQSTLLVPPIILSILKSEDDISKALSFCSIFVGIGFGASGGVFPSVMKALFGTKYYGTACSYVLGAVPIGIFASNWTYGYFYDIELKIQQNGTNYCYGSECFRNSFIVTALLQTITVFFAAMMFIFRSNQKRRASIST